MKLRFTHYLSISFVIVLWGQGANQGYTVNNSTSQPKAKAMANTDTKIGVIERCSDNPMNA